MAHCRRELRRGLIVHLIMADVTMVLATLCGVVRRWRLLVVVKWRLAMTRGVVMLWGAAVLVWHVRGIRIIVGGLRSRPWGIHGLGILGILLRCYTARASNAILGKRWVVVGRLIE